MRNALSGPSRLLMAVEFECAILNVLSAALLPVNPNSVSKTLALDIVKHCVIYSYNPSLTVKTLKLKCVTHFRINLFCFIYIFIDSGKLVSCHCASKS